MTPAWNLRLDTEALAAELSRRLESPSDGDDSALNAFFLVAGLCQIVDDYLHQEAFVRKRAERLRGSTSPLLGGLGLAFAMGADAVSRARALDVRRRNLPGAAGSLHVLAEALALATVGDPDTSALERARHSWHQLRPLIDRFPRALREAVVRLPDPFYRFDQAPEDFRVLAGIVADRWPDRGRPILVVGVRTSGTYLAHLYAALLATSGYGQVEVLTARPHQRWRRHETAQVRRATKRKALVLVVDDPPARGDAVARVAADLEQRGVERESIALVLQLFGPASSLPEPLGPYQAVLLPWREWSIHRRLDPGSVQRVLTRMLAGHDLTIFPNRHMRIAEVRSVERSDRPEPDAANGRRHVSARYRVCLVSEDGESAIEHVEVNSLGPGYFSDRARHVAAALAGSITAPIGIEGGLLYTRERPAEARIVLPIAPHIAERMTSYVVRRREALAVEKDASLHSLDDDTVWRVAADALGKALLGSARALAYPITHAISRRLLAVSRPCVIDGQHGLLHWSAPPTNSRDGLLKSHWLGRFTCYDAAYDLAAAAAAGEAEELTFAPGDHAEQPLGDRFLEEFRRQTNEEIDAERWLLYQLVELSTRLTYLGRAIAASRREGRDDEVSTHGWLATRRALARAHQRYMRTVFFSDLPPPDPRGPLCAFDVDWTLETRWLDFPALAPAGASALRALLRHGSRPVLASARSLSEVRDRCRAYNLAGGVAEFGAVLYDHGRDLVLPQVRPEERDALERLREVLARTPGVYLDPAYRYSARAVQYNPDRGFRGLDEETIQTAVTAADASVGVRVFRAGGQTDFVHESVDKGTGLRALAATLGVEQSDAPVAFAIGDDWPDLPMLDLAAAAFAPVNLSAPLRAELRQRPHVSVTRYPFGSGALEAVASFLRHSPRRCEVCRLGRYSSQRQRLLITALGGLDGPRRRRVSASLALAWMLAGAH